MVASPPPAHVADSAPDADANGRRSSGQDAKEKLDAECVEKIPIGQHAEGAYIPPEEIQARFDLLRDLSKEQMEALNKKVVKKIDWRMMPCVTLMFLMK